MIQRKVAAKSAGKKKKDDGKKETPEKALERELKAKEEELGKEHPDLVPMLEELRAVYFEQGEYRKALSFCNKAVEICEKKYGKSSKEVKEWMAKKTESDRLYRMQ